MSDSDDERIGREVEEEYNAPKQSLRGQSPKLRAPHVYDDDPRGRRYADENEAPKSPAKRCIHTRIPEDKRTQAIENYKQGIADPEFSVSRNKNGVYSVRRRKGAPESEPPTKRTRTESEGPRMMFVNELLNRNGEVLNRLEPQQSPPVPAPEPVPKEKKNKHPEYLAYFNNQHGINQTLTKELAELHSMYARLEDKYTDAKIKKKQAKAAKQANEAKEAKNAKKAKITEIAEPEEEFTEEEIREYMKYLQEQEEEALNVQPVYATRRRPRIDIRNF
jgi:hypothetical protein